MAERLVFQDAAGRVLTTRDLEVFTGQVDWQINGGHTVPTDAVRRHEEARAAGARGEYDPWHPGFDPCWWVALR